MYDRKFLILAASHLGFWFGILFYYSWDWLTFVSTLLKHLAKCSCFFIWLWLLLSRKNFGRSYIHCTRHLHIGLIICHIHSFWVNLNFQAVWLFCFGILIDYSWISCILDNIRTISYVVQLRAFGIRISFCSGSFECQFCAFYFWSISLVPLLHIVLMALSALCPCQTFIGIFLHPTSLLASIHYSMVGHFFHCLV